MALKDYFKDISRYVSNNGFFEKIKVSATSKDIVVQAMDKDKEVFVKGVFENTNSELKGVFGLSNLSLLQTITNDSEYLMTETSVKVIYESRNAEEIPIELSYENKSKSYINYRFMSATLIPDQPTFKDPVWDIIIKPSKVNIQQFIWAANGLAEYEQYFIPRIVDKELKFFIGEDDAATQRGGVIFSTDRNEVFDNKYKWKIQLLLPILKLADSCDCEMAFSTKGVIRITLNSGVGVYTYLFLAKVR